MQPRLLRSPARLASVSLLRVQTDERLVALARDGHEQAFATIVERYRTQLERYAARLVGPSRGEDAVQQAFVNAHSALTGDPEKTIELRPWLYRIVHNTSLNALRSARDEVPLGEEAERISLTDDAIERRELLREALDAVAALPAAQRDAILLRELEGRSHEEIAVALGVSPGAARQQIFRARAALRTAATAMTPMPLMMRLLEMATSSGGSGAADLATGAGAGLTAIIAKAGAGVLVTSAVVGGAAVGTGVVHTPTHHKTPAAAEAAHVAPARVAGSSAASASSASQHGAATADRGGRSGTRHKSSSSTHRDRGQGSHGHHGSSSGSGSASHETSFTPSRHSSSTSGHGGRSGADDSGHRQSHGGGGDSSGSGSHHQSGKGGGGGSGGSGSGKHGGHHASGAASPEAVEAPENALEAENEAAGDVSNKPADAGGAGGGQPTDPAAAGGKGGTAPVDPAAAGGGGGGGGGGKK